MPPPQKLSFVTLDVFTQDRYLGNPLAVVQVPSGQDVSTEDMQQIAREFNLSETIFVHDGEVDGEGVMEWKVRIFLVRGEVPFAGHPTIGAAVHTLSTTNTTSGRFLAPAGPINLTYTAPNAKASIPHNFHIHTRYPFTLSQLHALQPSLQDIPLDEKAITLASPVKGMSFVLVELPSLDALGRVTTSAKLDPKLDDYDGWDEGFCGSYFYVFTSGSSTIQTRMIEGSFEDPATGSAACALSCMLALKNAATSNSRVFKVEITQGVEMGRKSEIGVTVTLDQSLKSVEKVELSGSAVKVMEGVLEY